MDNILLLHTIRTLEKYCTAPPSPAPPSPAPLFQNFPQPHQNTIRSEKNHSFRKQTPPPPPHCDSDSKTISKL